MRICEPLRPPISPNFVSLFWRPKTGRQRWRNVMGVLEFSVCLAGEFAPDSRFCTHYRREPLMLGVLSAPAFQPPNYSTNR
jgi:hypothetical protein